MRRVVVVGLVVCALASIASSAGARVLRVGRYHGIKGQYKTLQAAVNAAKPGDWILIGPGDYKTRSSHTPMGEPNTPAAVLITTPGIYIRGMNRDRVIIDGTKPGSPRCSGSAADQNYGPHGKGLNGIMVWKADNVWVQNLTACNFLSGTGDAGNEVWWNGGDGSGKIGGWGFVGSYLTATTTFFSTESTAAAYGIFSSNWSGGKWVHTYASNFNDSGYYIGACQQVCDQTIDDAWAEFNALGYSGSNSGGTLVIKRSQFDNNEDGFDTNSQNGDDPPPQNGACPNNGISPITHTHSCWVFMHNFVHDNNNPNVPAAGAAAAGPVGTGMSVSGGRNDTVMHNTFVRNNAWGIILVPYADNGTSCPGGTVNGFGPGTCLWDDYGNAILNNVFGHNGSYGHPTNGDIAWVNLEAGHPTSCFHGNTEQGGGSVTTSPPLIEQTNPSCNGTPAASHGDALAEILCDSMFEGPMTPCPTGQYPRRTAVVMHALPKHLTTMPNPCKGVPANPWCPAHKHGHKVK